jgi:hypothetical protein
MEVVNMSASSKVYLDMIQTQLDMAKSALNSGYTGRARNLVEVIIADWKMLLVEPGGGKESK